MVLGEATPKLQTTTDEAFYARAGFLGYVAGNRKERKLVARVDLPPEVIEMPMLVDVIAGRAKGRTEHRQKSFFVDVGAIRAQFEAVAAAVYRKAREQGLGREIPTEWFLQDIRD
jgi:alanine dehydrogenase